MTEEKTKKFDVIFEGVARSSGKLRCDIDVDFVTTGESFSLATDEGKIHGGANTAPPPLALFMGALTACLMTQIRAFRNVCAFLFAAWSSKRVFIGRASKLGANPMSANPSDFIWTWTSILT